MSELISRAFSADLEVRSGATGRTIHGIVVPFDRVARVSDGGPSYLEMFRRGAFAKTIQERGARVKLLSQHEVRKNPLGRATLLREDAAGLYGEFAVSKTAAGDEVLELVRDGALDAFSVGFAPVKHTTERVQDRSVKVRTEVGLREASLVTLPAYEDALVTGVRTEDLSDDDLRVIAARIAELPPGTPAEPPGEGTPTGAAPPAAEPPVQALRADQRRALALAAFRTRGVAS